MKFKAFTIVLIISTLCLIGNIVNVYAWNMPSFIKIGLYFEKTAVTSIDIESQTGFQVGYEKDNQFYSLITRPDIKKFIVRKDSYYVDTGNGVVEYYPEGATIPQGTKYGAYHIQIGSSYNNYDDILQQINILKSAGLTTFPAIVNGAFYAWIGFYTSLEEANSVLSQVQSASGGLTCTVITPSVTRIQALINGIDMGFIFDDASNYLNIQPVAANDSVPLININKKPYRGGVEFIRMSGSDMTVINRVDLEQYLYGVLPREMGGNWPIEALKAQAVAARTFTILNVDRYKRFGFNLCDTTLSQVYGGYRSEHPNCTRAVEETRGKILTYDGKPANTYYFSTSGGHTEDVKNVWGSSIPYLKGVPDTYEPTARADKGSWTVEMTPQKISEALKSKGYDVGDILSVGVTEYSESGRAIKLKIIGAKAEIILVREEPRKIFGFNVLYSQMFTVQTNNNFYIINNEGSDSTLSSGSQVKLLSASGVTTPNVTSGKIVVKGADAEKNYSIVPQTYIFQGKGYGHGVGLSQWGAWGMAEAGFTYEQILTHYFNGTQIE